MGGDNDVGALVMHLVYIITPGGVFLCFCSLPGGPFC